MEAHHIAEHSKPAAEKPPKVLRKAPSTFGGGFANAVGKVIKATAVVNKFKDAVEEIDDSPDPEIKKKVVWPEQGIGELCSH